MDEKSCRNLPGYQLARRCSSMEEVRRRIDHIDRALVRLLAERQAYVDQAGRIKKDRKTVRDDARIADVIAKIRAAATAEGLDPDIAEAVWQVVIERAIAREFEIYDGRGSARTDTPSENS
jgi:isochorismate pyruvate lyase